MVILKVLSLIQPWATLIALGEKKIETRSWKTNYRGELYIHAGKKLDSSICNHEPFRTVLSNHGIIFPLPSGYIHDYNAFTGDIPTGMIIAKCQLVDCVKMADWKLNNGLRVIEATLENGQVVTGNELEFGDYAPGRYAWILDNIRPLETPIPAKGKLGLWEFQ